MNPKKSRLRAALLIVPVLVAIPSIAADLGYRSPLQDYRPFSDEKVVPWREANDNVGRIGGWREYAGEAHAPASAASAAARPSSAASAPAADHHGHAKP